MKLKIGTDKILHASVSMNLVVLLGLLLAWWSAAIVTAAVGICKEVFWDKLLGKGDCDWKDLVADAVGIVIGIVAVVLM